MEPTNLEYQSTYRLYTRGMGISGGVGSGNCDHVQYVSEANMRTSVMDINHLISRCTAIAAKDRSTRTIGIAAIVIPNSAESWATTRIKSCIRSHFRRGSASRAELHYLHGDTGEEEEIKFQQTDDNLVPSVHRCGGVASDQLEITTKIVYPSWQGSRRRCGR
jgi:hypothetical protein